MPLCSPRALSQFTSVKEECIWAYILLWSSILNITIARFYRLNFSIAKIKLIKIIPYQNITYIKHVRVEIKLTVNCNAWSDRKLEKRK